MDNNLTNEYLIREIKNGRKDLIDELFERNKNGIRKVAYEFHKKYYNTISNIGAYELEDIIQIANINFMKTIELYKEEKEAKYITFLMKYTHWQLYEHFFKRKQITNRLRHEYNKALIQYDTPYEHSLEIASMGRSNYMSPQYIEDFDTSIYIEYLIDILETDREKGMITDFYLNDMTAEQISIKYGYKNKQSARVAISKLVGKIKEVVAD